jgi:photosystem II stability/assembly factor-like uncharacterized protein
MLSASLAFVFALVPSRAQWQIETSNTTADLRGIHNVGNGVAWASGTNGTVLRTEDGGYVWQTCAIPPGAEKLDFRGIQAFDANTAIVMSSGKGDLSRLYKTTDGCHTWKLIFTNPDPDGFWDALVMTGPTIGVVLGDPVMTGMDAENLALRKSHFVFPTFHTIDGGQHWKRNDHNRMPANVGKDGQPSEAIFAASNSSLLLLPYTELFVTGGEQGGLRYLQYSFGAPPGSCSGCESFDGSNSTLASGETAGGFSIVANYDLSTDTSATLSRLVVIVGGDFKAPDRKTGTAAVCSPQKTYAAVHFTCAPAQTPPHGYRSSVAYDEETKTWITVGPNGTDISTDDGKNWRAAHPNAALHEPPDADRNWNAISLPYVVGPKGRIGKLEEGALK